MGKMCQSAPAWQKASGFGSFRSRRGRGPERDSGWACVSRGDLWLDSKALPRLHLLAG